MSDLPPLIVKQESLSTATVDLTIEDSAEEMEVDHGNSKKKIEEIEGQDSFG